MENRVGEKRLMNCGMTATIVVYRNNRDVDVLFEDGTLVTHKYYCDFARGQLSNPNVKRKRIGESRVMNCGMRAAIIEYRGAKDLDVQFEDGKIAIHKEYSNFLKGTVAYPVNDSRKGENRTMNCGMDATITRYGNANDIDVRFVDGTLVTSKSYNAFTRGYIANPNAKK